MLAKAYRSLYKIGGCFCNRQMTCGAFVKGYYGRMIQKFIGVVGETGKNQGEIDPKNTGRTLMGE